MNESVTIGYSPEIAGTTRVPGDKSLSHRALILAALAEGLSELTGLSDGDDVLSTVRCLRDLGIQIDVGTTRDSRTLVQGHGLRGLRSPSGPLDCGNSGTTMRLLMGVLAGQNFDSVLVGDASLTRRPMARVALPLGQMQASIRLQNANFAPVEIAGNPNLDATEVSVNVASAQVKSALILASLFSHRRTRMGGQLTSRDHTERLLPFFGVSLEVSDHEIIVPGRAKLRPVRFDIPGDPSSAAFLIAAATLAKTGDVTIQNVALNPTRIRFFEVLRRMGTSLEITTTGTYPEPVGSIRATNAALTGTLISPHEVPFIIDELPLIAVIAAFANGVTEVRGASELRLKESDRIDSIATNLRRCGADIETFADGFRIMGGRPLHAATFDSFDDHRIAMAFAVAGLTLDGTSTITGANSVAISYKNFFEQLHCLSGHRALR